VTGRTRVSAGIILFSSLIFIDGSLAFVVLAELLAVALLGILVADAGDATGGVRHIAWASAACAAAATATAAGTSGPQTLA